MMKIEIQRLASLTVHTGSVYTLHQNTEDAHSFFSAGGDGKVIRWNVDIPDSATLVAQVPSNIFSMNSIAGKFLLLGQMQGGIHVVDLVSKKEIKHLAHHRNGVFDIQILEDEIFAAGGDGMISVWDSADFSLKKNIALSDKSVRQIAFHPSGAWFAAACSDNNIYIVETNAHRIVKILVQHKNSVFSVCFSPDGKYLLSGSRDAHLAVWNVQHDFKLLHSIPAHLFTINCIAFSPDGKFFATASRDKSVKIWNAFDFTLLKVIEKEKTASHINSVNKLLWMTPNLFVSCSDDRAVMIWKIA